MRRALANVAGVASIECAAGGELDEPKRVTVDTRDEADPDAVAERAVSALVGAGLGVRSVARAAASLEEVFRELTREEGEP